MDKKLKIGKQNCIITETDTGVTVTGKFRGKAGRLLPRMDEKLVDGLREMGYPVGHYDSNIIEMCSATFQFVGVWKLVEPKFRDEVANSVEGQALARAASTISRRDCLARSVGFGGDEQANRKKIRDLVGQWGILCQGMWNTFSCKYSHLVHYCPQVSFDYADYSRRTNAPVRDDDIEWLRGRLNEVAQKIDELEQ